jgi:hypothetical protein
MDGEERKVGRGDFAAPRVQLLKNPFDAELDGGLRRTNRCQAVCCAGIHP